MRTKHQEKDEWTCKSCGRNSETLYFVCPSCMKEVRRDRIHKKREKADERR